MGTYDRVRTYVQGFDDKLSGGIPPGHLVILAGEPGTLKSTLAFNVLYHNAMKHDTPGAYISLEQSRESLVAHLKALGMDPADVEEKVSIVDLGMIRKNLARSEDRGWLEIFKMYAHNLKRSLNFEILVIDSLPVLEVMADFPKPREDLFHLFEWLRELKCTTFVVHEMKAGSEDWGRYGEEFIADGIIHTKMERVDDANIQRRIRCVKMRATGHSPNYYTLILQDGVLQATRVLAQ